MLFLDTHVALWLYAEPQRVPPRVRALIDADDLVISPMVRLEMALLREVGRITDEPTGIVATLEGDLGLEIEESGWSRAPMIAEHLSWTRDPFDRLITAHAMAFGAQLCTRDATIRDHYAHAVWG